MRKLLQNKSLQKRGLNKKLTGICFLLAAGLLAGSSVQEAKAESVYQEPPRFTAGTVRSLALVQDGEEIFRISNEPADYKLDFDYWEILNPYDENATVDTEAMYDLFEAVAAFDFSDAAETEEDTGIADTKTWITVEFANTPDTAEGTERNESSVTILIGREDGEGSVYAAVQGYEEQVYKLSAEAVTAVFDLKPFDYILKIPVLFNIETLDNVEIVIGEKNYTMKKEDGAYLFGKKKVKKETFTTLYQALMNVYLDSEAEEGKETKQEEILRMSFCRNTEEAPDVELVYRTFDDTHDSLSINGKESFLVKAEDVEALIQQIKDAF